MIDNMYPFNNKNIVVLSFYLSIYISSQPVLA